MIISHPLIPSIDKTIDFEEEMEMDVAEVLDRAEENEHNVEPEEMIEFKEYKKWLY